MSNPNNSMSSEFQSLLYYKFTFKKEYSKEEAAVFIDKAPDTMQRYCSGRLPVPVDIARDLVRFVLLKNSQDTELLEFFCPPGFLPVSSSVSRTLEALEEEIEKKKISLPIYIGKALEAIEKAYDDGKVERNEYKPIHKFLIRIQQVALELDKKIKDEVKGG